MRTLSVQKLTTAALLVAIGILIPVLSPIKIPLPSMSFTLASHVAIFIAMFLSPYMAVAVALGTTVGFGIAGFAPLVVWRAASHIIFAVLGGVYLQRHPKTLESPLQVHLFSLVIALIHAGCEALAATAFYFGGWLGEASYNQGYLYAVLYLVGIGAAIHSLVDMEIALVVQRALSRQKGFAALSQRG